MFSYRVTQELASQNTDLIRVWSSVRLMTCMAPFWHPGKYITVKIFKAVLLFLWRLLSEAILLATKLLKQLVRRTVPQAIIHSLTATQTHLHNHSLTLTHSATQPGGHTVSQPQSQLEAVTATLTIMHATRASSDTPVPRDRFGPHTTWLLGDTWRVWITALRHE